MKPRQRELELQLPEDGLRVEDLEAAPGRYRCIYADPPWSYADKTCEGSVGKQYDTMPLEDICNLPVPDLADQEGAHLWMWTTWPKVRDGAPHRVLSAWGFRWVGELVWAKPGLGVGRWLRPATEILILGVRGKLKLLRNNQKGLFRVQSIVDAQRGRHSQKPREFYEIIESLSPGPRIELFSRCYKKGWNRWGNQA